MEENSKKKKKKDYIPSMIAFSTGWSDNTTQYF